MGEGTAKQVQEMIVSMSKTDKSLLATIIGLIVVLVGATGVFVELQKTLNIIWEVKPKPRRAILTLMRTRLFSFGLILLWVSYSSMIFFYGAEFTRAYTNHITGRLQATNEEIKAMGLVP
jgi:uncharacterized BrkB/YihY/UPF0761 family membrane protein